jgi:5-methylcytosine-specific restriction protein B
VTSAPPPEDWNQEDREAFLAYQQGRKAVIVAPSIGQVPPVADDFAQRLFLPRPWLQQAIDLLNEKRQIIFYGPPGTGKTFVAQALAEHIEAAGGEWQLVQFHPTYSYEDFFEGYRPSKAEDGRTLQFDLRKGPLRLLAEKAAQNPQKPYLLVIDEINRGNIAKVFGELYFLLEYRDQPIRLQYSPEETFELPENLFVIGTMNTADRSIALVDSALRRRFYFFGFLPQEPPVEDVLAAWLEEKGYGAGAASLLRALNDALHEALPDEEFAIGPSYFMPKDGPPQLEKIWRYSIKPLLEERLYGTLRADEIERDFGLSAMQKRASGSENEGDEAESAS